MLLTHRQTSFDLLEYKNYYKTTSTSSMLFEQAIDGVGYMKLEAWRGGQRLVRSAVSFQTVGIPAVS